MGQMRKVFIDCGAWVGNSIDKFRELYIDNSEYEIFCFEPDEDNCKSIQFTHKGITTINKAVSDNDGTTSFYSCGKEHKESATITKEKHSPFIDSQCEKQVQCIDLSSWIKENFSKDDFIVLKLNVEGEEYKVIYKMINDGTIYYINDLYVDWHYNKMEGFTKDRHDELVNKIPIEHKEWNLMHNQKVLYTVITGENEYRLNEPKRLTEGWDHICFTNRDNLKSNRWKIIKLDEKIDDKKLSRKVKILCDKYLPQYEVSIYVDSRFINGVNLEKFYKRFLPYESNIAVMVHNRRNCLYKEAEFLGLENTPQIYKYRKDGMPEGAGLFAPGIMIRRHNKEDVIKFCEMWWREVEKHSHRDMLSFAYCKYKTNLNLSLMPFKNTYDYFMGRI